jgi:DNA-binding CsgD family transcriptional regulator
LPDWRKTKAYDPSGRKFGEGSKVYLHAKFDVLCYLLGGQINREIAAKLGVTERTIKVHRGQVMKKLGVRSTAQLFPMVLRVLRGNGMQDTSHKTRRRT